MQKASRAELYPVSQCVQVRVDGKLLADSTQALEFIKQAYPPRHCFPREDVRMDLVTTSETTIYCLFKGNAVYFPLGLIKDVAWSYEHPVEGMEAVAGRVALAGEGERGG